VAVPNFRPDFRQIEALEAKIRHQDAVMARLLGEHVTPTVKPLFDSCAEVRRVRLMIFQDL